MEEEHIDQITSTNEGMMNPSFLQLRLDMSSFISKVEQFLSGRRRALRFNQNNQQWEEDYLAEGEPYANKKGITGIVNFINLRANSHTVQGNFKQDDFKDMLHDTRKELTEMVVSKCYDWEIKDSDIEPLINSIMGFYKPFLSRLLENKERESYMKQFQTREVNNFRDPSSRGLAKGFSI